MTGVPAPRPRPAAQVGWAVVFLAGGFALTIALATILAKALGGLREASTATLLILQSGVGLAAFGFLTWSFGVRFLGLSSEELRYRAATRPAAGFGAGVLLGVGPAALALLLSLGVGGARFTPDAGSMPDYLAQMARTLVLLAPAALLEEVMFRGVSQVLLARVMGRAPAVLTLSVLFALAHLANPNGTALGLVNIGLAGVFLGAVFYSPGGIWAAWGAHLGWNAMLAAADAPVSGLPFPIPLINYFPGGPDWLTGGSFGPEGGVLATGAIALATVVAWRWQRKEPQA